MGFRREERPAPPVIMKRDERPPIIPAAPKREERQAGPTLVARREEQTPRRLRRHRWFQKERKGRLRQRSRPSARSGLRLWQSAKRSLPPRPSLPGVRSPLPPNRKRSRLSPSRPRRWWLCPLPRRRSPPKSSRSRPEPPRAEPVKVEAAKTVPPVVAAPPKAPPVAAVPVERVPAAAAETSGPGLFSRFKWVIVALLLVLVAGGGYYFFGRSSGSTAGTAKPADTFAGTQSREQRGPVAVELESQRDPGFDRDARDAHDQRRRSQRGCGSRPDDVAQRQYRVLTDLERRELPAGGCRSEDREERGRVGAAPPGPSLRRPSQPPIPRNRNLSRPSRRQRRMRNRPRRRCSLLPRSRSSNRPLPRSPRDRR